MPSYAKLLEQTYYPLQAAEARWTASKAAAAGQFSALEAERKALEEVRAQRLRYAENIRVRSSNDAFKMQALIAQAGVQPPGGGGGGGENAAYNAALAELNKVGKGANFGSGNPARLKLDAAIRAAPDQEMAMAAYNAAVSKDYTGPVPEAVYKKPTREQNRTEASKGNKAAQKAYQAALDSGNAQMDLAEDLGPRGFEGGAEGKAFYKGLTPADQELLNLYQQALSDDAQVTSEELRGRSVEAGKALYDRAAAVKGYRGQDRAVYDPSYLALLKEEAGAAQALSEKRKKFEGKSMEGEALRIFRAASGGPPMDPLTGMPVEDAVNINPLLRSLTPDIARVLNEVGVEGDFEAYTKNLTPELREKLKFAKLLQGEGKTAAQVQQELLKGGKTGASEARQVLAIMAAEEASAASRSKVAAATPKAVTKTMAETNKAAINQAELKKQAAEVAQNLQARMAAAAEEQKTEAEKSKQTEADRRRALSAGIFVPASSSGGGQKPSGGGQKPSGGGQKPSGGVQETPPPGGGQRPSGGVQETPPPKPGKASVGVRAQMEVLRKSNKTDPATLESFRNLKKLAEQLESEGN